MMDFFTTNTLNRRKAAGALVIPFWKGAKHAEVAAHAEAATDVQALRKQLSDPLASEDFKGAEGELLVQYVSGQPEMRFILLGLGSKLELSVERLRRSYAKVQEVCAKKKLKSLNLILPKGTSMAEIDIVRGVSEGLLLPNYSYSLKADKHENKPALLEHAVIIGATKSELALSNKVAILCESVNFVRDLVNGNADDVTPQHLAAVAKGLEKTCEHVKTTVFDKKRIEKEKMGLLLAVSRGSALDPALIIVEYKGDPKSSDRTVIVGKGITYDTGGLILKPKGSMETMKDDMSGGAAALGVIRAISALGLKINVTSVVPSAENCIGSKSYKPGDVYSSYSGKTVEVADTDAEGRLVLADAIAYAVKNLKPSRIIDLATLTGSIIIALGEEASGLMTNNDAMGDLLAAAGSETGERVWRMPLYPDYKDQLKSDIADIKNVGGRSAGSITAAIFLQEFVGDCPWAHLDIAGTAFLSERKRYTPKHATGVGVRLLVAFLESL